MAFTSISTDVYLPAMPAMHDSLHGDIELTIFGFLCGFSIAQLVWGPISDRFGRKLPLYLGMVLFVIGSIGCACSESITQIVVWRVIQAIGACTGPMLARTIIRDMYSRTQAAQTLSTLFMIMAIAPIIGPIIGGQIITFSSWHSIFWMLGGLGGIMLIALQFLPETLPEERRVTAPVSNVFVHYYRLLKNVHFMQFTLCVTLYYVAAYAFIVGSPASYISYFGVSEQSYGFLFAINILGVMVVSYFNRKLVHRYAIEILLKISTMIAAFSIVTLFLITQFNGQNFWAIVVAVFLFFSMNGIIAACATTAALDLVPDHAGSASALIGALQYGSGIVSSLILAYTDSTTPLSMIIIMTVFSCLSVLMALGAHKRTLILNVH